jgi:tetratricopeptide (TPR) repeat protein
VDAFAWDVVGSLAGVIGAVAAIVFGVVPLRQNRRRHREFPSADAGSGAVTTTVVGEIPQAPVAFRPRPELLAALEGDKSSVHVIVVAVTGMRGVGKTHLAAGYARAKVADGWRLVAWINAEEPTALLGGMSEIAAALGLEAAGAVPAGRAVRHWLETGGRRCLLVFDNATDPAALRPFIPAAGAAQVIITSTEQSMRYLGTGVPVDVFTTDEALQFLAARTGLADPEGAGLVAAELGYLPLALAQAAAVIEEQRLGYAAYLDRVRALPVGQLLRPQKAGQYPRGVAAAVLLSIEGVQADDGTGAAVTVMELLSVLSPAGVRRTMMHAAGQQGVLGRATRPGGLGADAVDQALARLAGASLLTFSVDGSVVTAHRLVMRVIREQAAARDSLASICAAAGALLSELAGPLERTWHEDRAGARDLAEQIMALYGSSPARPQDGDLTRLLLRLRSWASLHLSYLDNDPAQSIATAGPLLADYERVLGADHPDTLAARNYLALAYGMADRTAEALALYEQNLADCERLLGRDHPDTFRARGNVAVACWEAGRTAEALALLERDLADCERVLGSDHIHTLAARGNLASFYREAGRTAEAIALFERNLADRERVLGRDHPDTLMVRGQLAVAYQSAGRTAEAIAVLEQNVADRERVLGSDHPSTVSARSKLAGAYQAAGHNAATGQRAARPARRREMPSP